jgi:hypothetical protein
MTQACWKTAAPGLLARLHQAKDKAEFDQFMADRRNRPPEQAQQA